MVLTAGLWLHRLIWELTAPFLALVTVAIVTCSETIDA